jgi:alpha/beta superfamily hydrolase
MDEERITFSNARGDTLVGVLHHPARNGMHGAAILCHGMESDKSSEKLIFLSRALAQAGVAALRFDFSFVGESSGKFQDLADNGEVDDLRAAYDRMQERYPGKIAILGSSMSGTVALLFAAQQPQVAALATLAAPLRPEDFPKRMLTPAELQQWCAQGYIFYHRHRLNVTMLEDLDRIDVVAAATKVRCPALILHGDADEVVPVEEAHELYGCLMSSKRLSILTGADHRLSDPTMMRQAMAEALDWLTEHVG